jgi:uncharacterized membrane protein
MQTTATPVSTSRSNVPATLAAAAIFLVVATVFLVSASNWYAVFKTVHVLAAIVWLGGGALILVIGMRAQLARDSQDVVRIARQAAFAGERIFAPAGLVVVLMGIAMMINGDLDWGQFWVIAGLIGYGTTFAVGIGYLSPLSKKIARTAEEKGEEDPETQALIDRILLVGRFDVAMLLLVVVDMVAKPFS